MKRGFVLILTIFILILFSYFVAMILSLSSNTSETAVQQYLYSQAKLLARSGVEFAVLMIQDRNNSQPCLEELSVIDKEKEFNTTIYINYIGDYWQDCGTKNFWTTTSSDSNGSILIDVYVRYLQNGKVIYHRKLTQKP